MITKKDIPDEILAHYAGEYADLMALLLDLYSRVSSDSSNYKDGHSSGIFMAIQLIRLFHLNGKRDLSGFIPYSSSYSKEK